MAGAFQFVSASAKNLFLSGLGAISAAVMSSIDSSILASSSVFVHNIYRGHLRRKVLC